MYDKTKMPEAIIEVSEGFSMQTQVRETYPMRLKLKNVKNKVIRFIKS